MSGDMESLFECGPIWTFGGRSIVDAFDVYVAHRLDPPAEHRGEKAEVIGEQRVIRTGFDPELAAARLGGDDELAAVEYEQIGRCPPRKPRRKRIKTESTRGGRVCWGGGFGGGVWGISN